ncbi:MAG: ribulose-phosphate 3-epimerase [candidate division Zixibacteria bacterium]|nr:ribulose-phosphate 3-epimerase [candidate division Zixibacteria bacterium]
MIKIAPSILSADFRCLEEEIKKIEKAGADLIHLDIMDGHFVPNITFGPMIVNFIRLCTKLHLDVHLMIENPDLYLEKFVQAGADYLTVHLEGNRNIHRTLTKIKSLGVKNGCVLNPGTSFCLAKPIMGEVDLLLLKSVNPGFGGRKFITSVLKKIKEAKKFIQDNKLRVEIEVDGGINPETAKKVKDAGATILVAGDAVFKSKDYKKIIKKLREA